MMNFNLTTGAVLTVTLGKKEFLYDPAPVSFYASNGTLDDDLVARLDQQIPVEWSGPEMELGEIVRTVLGELYTPGASSTVSGISTHPRPHVPAHAYPGMSDDPWAD